MVEKLEGAIPKTEIEGGDMTAANQELGSAELEVLNKFLQSACCTLLDVNKDLFNRELHLDAAQELVKTFANDKNIRVLVIAKIEKAAGSAPDTSADKDKSTSMSVMENEVSLNFSTKVEYMGTTAHTIALLKREQYVSLDLRPEMDITKALEMTVESETQTENAGESHDLSQQLQVVNLGYLGQDSNIFELASTYVDFSFLPLFQDFKAKSEESGKAHQQDPSAAGGLDGVLKDLSSLKIHLAQCRQNLEIPMVELKIDPDVKAKTDEIKKAGQRPTVADFEEHLKDSEFINKLLNLLNQWYKDIRKVLSLEHQIENGTALQEINFWAAMERSLIFIKEQLATDEVQIILDCLSSARKYRDVTSFNNDASIVQKLATSKEYNKVLQQIPVKSLMDATDLGGLAKSIPEVFKELKKLRQGGEYPLDRGMSLAECIAREFDMQLNKVVSQHPIMQIPYDDYKSIAKDIMMLQEVWQAAVKGLKEIFKKGLQTSSKVSSNPNQVTEKRLNDMIDDPMFKRLSAIGAFRTEHHKLEQVIHASFSKEGGAQGASIRDQSLSDVKEAYEVFAKNVNPFDYSKEGTQLWDIQKKQYDQATSKVEHQLTQLLKQKLESAGSASEMFQVFAVYGQLFLRPKIRGAITQYQSQLLLQVNNDINQLKDKLMNEAKVNRTLNETRDFPDIVNKVIWMQQLNSKLLFYQNQVKEVLGADWEFQQEGAELKRLCELLANRIKKAQQNYFQQWHDSITSLTVAQEREKKIFHIEQKGNKFQLALSINENLFRLNKEKIAMERAIQHFNLPHKISVAVSIKCQQVESILPIAMSLKQSLRTFQVTNSKVDPSFEMLVADKRKEAQKRLMHGLKTSFTRDSDTKVYAQKLLPIIISFEDAVNSVGQRTEYIYGLLGQIEKCDLVKSELSERLDCIQRIISDFDLENLSNLNVWVDELNDKIEKILTRRLEQLLESWVDEFKNFDENGGNLIKKKSVLDIKLQNRCIQLEPPLAEVRAYWYKKLHKQVEVICGLNRVGTSQQEAGREATYHGLLSKMEGQFSEVEAYVAIEGVFNEAEEYFQTWKNYQAMWDIEQNAIFEILGDDIEKWNQLLNEIKQGRKVFDTSEDYKCFGGLEISYGNVQSKVNNKYDQLHKEVLQRFGSTLSVEMKAFKDKVQEARRKLENLSYEGSEDVTVFVTEIQEMKRVVDKWEEQLDRCKNGCKLLQQQRFQWPQNWLHIDYLESEWATFKQILAKRSATMEEQIPTLQAKIIREEESVNAKIREIEAEWKDKRPQAASKEPQTASPSIRHAINFMTILGAKITSCIAELERVCKAKELLNMDLGDAHVLDSLQEDHSNLLNVWQLIQEIWVTIDQIDHTPFKIYVHKTVKEGLDIKMNEMREFPNRIRSYQIYDQYMEHIKNYKKVNDILSEMRSDSVKPKHWKELLNKLRITVKFQDLTLADLWCADILGKNKHVQDVLTSARGEAILENFLNGIKEIWSGQELELVWYQKKCKLIRGWDDLFAQIDEHMNNINSMKMSPYYKVFEKEIEPWYTTLEQIRVTFDYWIDVQRRYVYLEGIFFGSADIKSMLPNEFNRFKQIDDQFTRLMKQVNKQPNVLEVMKIPSLEKNLVTFTEALDFIQKALGVYLEEQRSNFPRFYFVGDEDLLEIIGNSKAIQNVQRHFPKMFMGITTVNFENEGDTLTGMNSKEGESVSFTTPVVISENPTIYKWLTKVEEAMQISLAIHLDKGVQELEILDRINQQDEFNGWITKWPAQLVLLAMIVSWSSRVEDSLNNGQGKSLNLIEESIKLTLEMLAERVLTDLTKDIRQKYEQLITDLVHQRVVTRQLINERVTSASMFAWLYHMRFYWNARENKPVEKLQIQMANGDFFYGFEYLGVGEKLVQTPLTDRCYLTLTQALHWRMGGSPFGPAGTGKTESVKALGAQLGRFTLVFNCDETFDGNAMGRIFIGLCQVGAWGCFDEFNRLEERMLSAVSQQILLIQTGLKEMKAKIDLMDRNIKLNNQMGIFITMNPDYAGRSQLPDNLKQLFRQMAMVKPDKEMIARVMLYSQGFKTAEILSGKIVSLFDLCHNQLSSQSHYDFGLRALKSVLVSAGNLKRMEKAKVTDPSQINEAWETNILIKSLCDTLVPKLIADDIPLLSSLLSGVFPGSSIVQQREGELKDNLEKVVEKYNLLASHNFIEKCMQLYQIQFLHHGVMMVGPTGVGKTSAWKLLLDCMERVDKIKGESYVVDPKAINKDELYGKLDATNADWTDGVFTGILRKIIGNERGESQKRHWIIFDGDVDPEWAENLNSVLDDNKLLTLPSGERLQIPPNVRIMFEVETLRYATLATVSRCGMVWFSNETVDSAMMYHHYLCRLAQDTYDSIGEEIGGASDGEDGKTMKALSDEVVQNRRTRKVCVEAIKTMFDVEEEYCFGTRCLELAEHTPHIMEFTRMRCLEATFALIRRGIENIIEFQETQSDFPLDDGQITTFMQKYAIFSTIWGIGGSMNLATRTDFSNKIADFTNVETPSSLGTAHSLIDYEIRLDDQKWHLWKESVPDVDIDPKKVTDADVIITTVDTTRHQEVLCNWLSEKRPFILCGPPGSGKTMTLMATLKKLTDMEMIFINFSSSTTPELILKTFDHYCEVKKTNSGLVMSPLQANKWLVVFCDEINLPEPDKYSTQVVITFLRQITEQNGYWRKEDKQWVRLDRIMFVGACNPPTDAGRTPLSDRFLRHAPLIFVDFPGPESLRQIYGTFNRAMLKKVNSLKNHADALTGAMVEFYSISQQHFTADQQPHYIYSPRELTRWKYAVFEALEPLEDVEDLVRLFVHEGLRLFEDRLVYQHEKDWCNKAIDEVAQKHFPQVDCGKALARPIYFTNYLHKCYCSVGKEELQEYIEARLKQFQEEELDVPLVVFDSVLDHILRIDRVLRQPLGHLLLVGASGVGKTTLTRFVSWMQDLEVFQIKAGRNYSVHDFDEDLRKVMRMAGVDRKKICFIFDESNVLSAGFLERMNALLAAGEVPGLFDGEDYTKLIDACKQESRKNNQMLDTEDELYKQFTKDVQRNLHVVFTMNPANPDFSNRTASSPALFNRCVIDWFGDWTDDGLLQVSKELIKFIEVQPESFTKDMEGSSDMASMGGPRSDPKQECLAQCIVDIHAIVRDLNIKLSKSAKKFNYITPRDFLDFIRHFVDLQREKKNELEEQQQHLETGITKLKNSEQSVQELGVTLRDFDAKLKVKKVEVSKTMTSLTNETNKVTNKKAEAEKTAVKLEKAQKDIEVRKVEVNRDLSKAEPALIAAMSSVQGVEAKHINELKALRNPPEKVRIAMEPVIALLTNTGTKATWENVRKEITKADFKDKILNFDKDTISSKCKNFIVGTYLQDETTYDIAAFMKASKVAGPLALWCKSIVEYAEIFEKIAPLREEVDSLQDQADVMQTEFDATTAEIQALEDSLETMKTQFQHLVQEQTRLEEEQKTVKNKMDRSNALFKNLSSELTRWIESSKNFKDRMSSLMGDVLLSSAVLTYIGFFDHLQRQNLQVDWRMAVDSICLRNTPTLSFTEFLCKPQERLLWQQEELPNDDLCITNALIMKRYNRYPLIIDPSDQALKYIMNHYKKQKIQKTSFADTELIARVSEGLQYGVPILIQDVEKIDPIMNNVLNKEVQKVGGRLIMQVGDKEIACNGELILFMLTRDPNAIFTPDLCSRVTFVNFTVTPSSLMSQCLNIYLKNEREDVERKRNDLLRVQGEFKEKLRLSEDQLLDALNKAEGEILENDALIQTLESIKKEAARIAIEVEKTDETLEEIKEVSDQYQPLSMMTTRIFFTLESLGTISYLYQYSLHHFMDLVFDVLKKNEILKEVPKTEHQKRLKIITQQLFLSVNQTICQGLLQSHQMLFTMRLAQIALVADPASEELFELFMRSSTMAEPKQLSAQILDSKLMKTQVAQLEELSYLDKFQGLGDSLDSSENQWIDFISHPIAENCVPEPWCTGSDISTTNLTAKALKKLTVLKVVRPDRLLSGVQHFVRQVLGEDINNTGQANLADFVAGIHAKSPMLLVSAPGYDASYKVDMLAKQLNKKYTSVAIGSPEAFGLVDTAIRNAAKSGSWVLLKNVHLAPAWLVELEKKIYNMTMNADFRLFLTMENNPKVPSTLLRASHVLVFEPPSGIKAALERSYSQTITPQRTDKDPIERKRLHFIVSWFNAVVQERLRYTPIGWSKVYEFNESDQRCTLDCIDEWIDSMGKGRSNVDPDKIPWDALRTLISQSVFGGKIDNEFDNKILLSLVDQFFRPESFNSGFKLFENPGGAEEDDVLAVPDDAKNHKDYFKWIKDISMVETPAWSGLPNNVEKIVREREANNLVTWIKLIQGTGDDLVANEAEDDGKSAWLVQLQTQCEQMLNKLPGQLELLQRTAQAITNPLFRFLEREVTVASGLLDTVKSDLVMLKEMCEGTRKSTNMLKQLAEALNSDVIPTRWRKYTIANISATNWVNDFVKRVEQLKVLSAANDFGQSGLWFGGLLFPEAYLTATRQSVAQKNDWSLEELTLKFELDLSEEDIAKNSQGFILTGFSMEGAEYSKKEDRIKLTESLSSTLPNVNFKWIHKSEAAKEEDVATIDIPVYLNKTRRNLLVPVSIPTYGVPNYVWYQRGVALFAWDKE